MTVTAAYRTPADRNAEATVHIGQLDEKVTDALLWELMVQAGPVRHVYIPRNRITGAHFGYGFCEFHTALDAFYATKVLNMLSLFSKSIRVSQSSVDRTSQDVGAHLFVGNLVDEVDEKLLHDAFSSFGPLIEAPYIMRDVPNSKARRYGFVKYSQFEHSDAAIAAMNGQYICNHPITVQYAFKKDSDSRERHGSNAERILAARALQSSAHNDTTQLLRPNTLFSDRPARPMRHPPQPPVSAHPPQLPPNFPYMPMPPGMPPFPMPHPNSATGPIPPGSIPVHTQHLVANRHASPNSIPILAAGSVPAAAYSRIPYGMRPPIPPHMPAALPPGIPPAFSMSAWQQPGMHPQQHYDPNWSHHHGYKYPPHQLVPQHLPPHVDPRISNYPADPSHGTPTPVVDDDAPPPPTN